MTDSSVGRPGIDPFLKMLLDAIPLAFSAADGVEVAQARLAALKAPQSCCRTYGLKTGPSDTAT